METGIGRRIKRALAICAMLFVGGGAAHAEVVEINLASAYPDDNFQTQNLRQFAEDVRRATAGQVNIRIQSGGALLKAPLDIYNGVRSGKAEAGEAIMSGLAKENVLFGLDALPFIVSGYDDAHRMWDVQKPGVDRLMAAKDLQLLYAVPWPPQNLYSKGPINSVKDFKGLSMRNYSPATERIAELIGAKPVTIQVVDLAKAISDEKLDLMLTSSWTGVDTKAWTKLQYYYKVSAWIPKNMVFMQKKLFAKLDEATRKKVIDAAQAAEKRGWKLSQDSDQNYENQLAANKINVQTMEPYIRKYLDRIGESLARDWLKQAGNEEMMILLKYTTDRSMK
jgi:TRAP-type transport system periplasmic protein